MIEIDGSQGEGGGQMVRTALSLSALTGEKCRITNIRAKRKNPGLQPQHKAAVDAVARLCDAEVSGSRLGGKEILFSPGKIRGGSLSLNIGTAGSTALVIQALMLPAMHAEKPLELRITGGTTNKWAPSVAYMTNVTLPLLKKSGYKGEITLQKHGFYPTGGGLVEARLRPAQLERIELTDRGRLVSVNGICTATEDLKKTQVAERMQSFLRGKLFAEFKMNPNVKTAYVKSASTGGGCDLFAVYEDSVIGAASVAERGVRAEDVAREALAFLTGAHKSGAALDIHMADQIIPYLAVAGGAVSVEEVSMHARTNMQVCELFGASFRTDERQRTISCQKAL